jgi:hypothetical protein
MPAAPERCGELVLKQVLDEAAHAPAQTRLMGSN